MIRRSLVFLIFLCFTPQAFAISGHLRSSTDFYQKKLGPPTDETVPWGQLELTDKQKLSKRWRFQWKLFALGNFEAGKPGENEEKLANEQSYVDVQEAFIEFKPGAAAKFRLGYNTVNWGMVDVSSPANVVNTSAFLHPLRLPRRGSPMVEMTLGKEEFGISALYIPRQPRAVLPARDSRWLPRDILTNIPTGLAEANDVILPETIEYRYLADTEMDHARDHNYGAKLYSHLGSWDFQLTYFEGQSPFPKFSPVLSLTSVGNQWYASKDVGLGQVQYKVRNSGLGITYAAEKMIFRLESVYQHTLTDPSKVFGLEPWKWSSVFGIETNVDIGSSTLTILTQYFHTEIPIKADNLISSSYRLFDRTGVLGLRWPMNDRWTLSASALLETQTHGLFWSAAVENKISDSLKMAVGWRDFSAQDPGLLKTFDKNDHANLEMTYYF